jgi:hypothetical protein
MALMKRLANAGPEERKFLRMLVIYVDVTAPLYWWKEMDTYKVGTVSDSCSTMHTLHKREITLDDFSLEHISTSYGLNTLDRVIASCNLLRNRYLETKDKKYWYEMIQLLPSSYNQTRTLMLNYEVALSILRQRSNHKLDEWHTFCDWLRTLPYMTDLEPDRIQAKVRCRDCKYLEGEGVNTRCRHWTHGVTREDGFCWAGVKR